MSQADTRTRPRAVIFIPPKVKLSDAYAAECMGYALDNGYVLKAFVRSWDEIDRLLRNGQAEVAVAFRTIHNPEAEKAAAHEQTTVLHLGEGVAAELAKRLLGDKSPAQRLLDVTADRWSNEFHAWMFSRRPLEG